MRLRLPPPKSTQAWSRVELLITLVVLGFLVCLAIPWLIRSRNRARSICCNCNLKQVTLGFKVWANDHLGKYPMEVSITNGGTMERATGAAVFPHFQVISKELVTPFILVCPADKQRSPATNFLTGFNDNKLSYFVGVDATDSLPQTLLAGDRNIATNGVPLPRGLHGITSRQTAGWTQDLHRDKGNIGLADGSVQTASSDFLAAAILNSGADTNRLSLP
jgi:competence protein ComGC